MDAGIATNFRGEKIGEVTRIKRNGLAIDIALPADQYCPHTSRTSGTTKEVAQAKEKIFVDLRLKLNTTHTIREATNKYSLAFHAYRHDSPI
jgi:hypothetical protein